MSIFKLYQVWDLKNSGRFLSNFAILIKEVDEEIQIFSLHFTITNVVFENALG